MRCFEYTGFWYGLMASERFRFIMTEVKVLKQNLPSVGYIYFFAVLREGVKNHKIIHTTVEQRCRERAYLYTHIKK